ncbi:hypothetical protein [Zunongwangia sp. HRR-M8]|uniref:hypothetical protein n=1 Tax=Zunongwangia sp. HRR-M8 TaxID=3015170 RepID=UPI0022DD73E7|nr:hypothetical protein [Zunongwangia sp. HRR-M8]WBL23315.1 hypothetical protein PBT89_05020 [Zunongwangia sp. HRR-M8]
MNYLVFRHFSVLEKFISEFNESKSLLSVASNKREQSKAEYKMDLVIFNFEIYTSKYPEIYNFFLGKINDEFKRREAWDKLRSKDNFVPYLKNLMNSFQVETA